MKKIPTPKEIKKLEKTRKRLKHNNIILGIIVIFIIVFLFPFIKFFAFVAAFVIGILLGCKNINYDLEIYRKNYKETIILEIFNKIFKDVEYIPDSIDQQDNIYDIKLFYDTDEDYNYQYKTHDTIKAKYKKTNFTFTELQCRSDQTPYLFSGQWYVFDFHKPFKSNVLVITKNFFNRYKTILKDKSLHQVELEDIKFNESFIVLAKNKTDAFYILTPQIMENIKLLNKNISDDLIIIFKKNEIHVGVNSFVDKFEPNIYKEINLSEIENKTIDELKPIIDLIENIDLNNSLFRKEE